MKRIFTSNCGKVNALKRVAPYRCFSSKNNTYQEISPEQNEKSSLFRDENSNTVALIDQKNELINLAEVKDLKELTKDEARSVLKHKFNLNFPQTTFN